MGGWRQVSATVSRISPAPGPGGNLLKLLAAAGQWPGHARGQHSITQSSLPSHAQVVIAGAGMIGNSIAYHLVKKGWRDIVIIEKGNVAEGISKYGSGMMGLFRPQHEREIVQYCIDLYQNLQEEGHDLGLEHCGSVNLAATKDRWISLKRRASAYRPTGVECHLVSPEEIRKLHPYVNTDGILGGVYMPKDACVNAGKVSEVLALVASKEGAKFVSGCGVKKVITSGEFSQTKKIYQ